MLGMGEEWKRWGEPLWGLHRYLHDRVGLGTNMGISNWCPNDNAILVAIVGKNLLAGWTNSPYIRRRSWGIYIRAQAEGSI